MNWEQHVGHQLGILPDGMLVCDTCEVEVEQLADFAAMQRRAEAAEADWQVCEARLAAR